MQEQLVTFETAKLAKERGFDAPVWNYWHSNIEGKWNNFLLEDEIRCHPILDNYNDISDKHISQPTQSLLQKWIRKICGLQVEVILCKDGRFFYNIWKYEGILIGWTHIMSSEKLLLSFEEVLEIGLQEALKIIK